MLYSYKPTEIYATMSSMFYDKVIYIIICDQSKDCEISALNINLLRIYLNIN